jgi:hypothetical protein
MMTETGIITRVEEIGSDAIAIPLMSVTPKSLLIVCQTVHGPLNVRISKDAAHQLAEALNTHFCECSDRKN